MAQCTVKRTIRHSPPLDLCWFVKFNYRIQTVVTTRTKRLKKIFINTLCSRWQLFQILCLSDPAPVRTLFALNQVNQFIQFYHKQLHFFSINNTTIPTAITIFHKYLSNVVHLLSTSYLSHKIHFKSMSEICFCLHSLKDDVSYDG